MEVVDVRPSATEATASAAALPDLSGAPSAWRAGQQGIRDGPPIENELENVTVEKGFLFKVSVTFSGFGW